METDTYSEIAARAEYDEERMHFNNDNLGRAENPADLDDDGPSDEALVPAKYACPECGEMRMDCLANNNDTVTCLSCGTVYELPTASFTPHPVKPDGMSDDDWNEYQQWVAEELAAPYPVLTPEYLEIAGCYSPREC